jgi:hypothetical protein
MVFGIVKIIAIKYPMGISLEHAPGVNVVLFARVIAIVAVMDIAVNGRKIVMLMVSVMLVMSV